MTLSPAMGRYLNMANNNKANPAKGTAANENYARELMQLFTLGLTQLNPDGTPVLDQNNNPIPTYDQTVVTNMAKVLTGWTYPTAPGATAKEQQSGVLSSARCSPWKPSTTPPRRRFSATSPSRPDRPPNRIWIRCSTL